MTPEEMVTLNTIAFVTSEGGDLTLEFVNKDNTRRALLGINYSGKLKNWMSLISLDPPSTKSSIPVTNFTEALRAIDAHVEDK